MNIFYSRLLSNNINFYGCENFSLSLRTQSGDVEEQGLE
jgi:hypothetical protein